MIAGICLVRNADDIIITVVEHMLTQVDLVIVADNLSTDRTREYLDAIRSKRLTVVDDTDPAHRQGAKTTALAQVARERGATWVVPFDSDEIWYSPYGTIGALLGGLPEHMWIAPAVLFDHVATGADPDVDNPVERIRWRRTTPNPLPKVACRTAVDLTIHEGNHGASYESDASSQTTHGLLAIRHFPYRSPEQMYAKAHIGAEALRAASELDEDIGKHWRDYDALGPDVIRDVFYEHFHADDPSVRDDLVFDPAPCR